MDSPRSRVREWDSASLVHPVFPSPFDVCCLNVDPQGIVEDSVPGDLSAISDLIAVLEAFTDRSETKGFALEASIALWRRGPQGHAVFDFFFLLEGPAIRNGTIKPTCLPGLATGFPPTSLITIQPPSALGYHRTLHENNCLGDSDSR